MLQGDSAARSRRPRRDLEGLRVLHSRIIRSARWPTAKRNSRSNRLPRPTETEAAPRTADPDAGARARAEKPGPQGRLITRVVVGYRLGFLPGEWLQTWRRLDRALARANLKVKATLAPLEEVPKDTGILVVSPDLREAAREAVPPGTPILVTPANAAAGAFNDLVARLEAGTELRADKISEEEAQGPKIVSYTGYTRND